MSPCKIKEFIAIRCWIRSLVSFSLLVLRGLTNSQGRPPGKSWESEECARDPTQWGRSPTLGIYEFIRCRKTVTQPTVSAFSTPRGLGKVEGKANGAEMHLPLAELRVPESKWNLTVRRAQVGPWEGTLVVNACGPQCDPQNSGVKTGVDSSSGLTCSPA